MPKTLLRTPFIQLVAQAIAIKNKHKFYDSSAYIYHNPGLLRRWYRTYDTLGKSDYVIFASDKAGQKALEDLIRRQIQLGFTLTEMMTKLYDNRAKDYVRFVQDYAMNRCRFKIHSNVSMKSQLSE